MKFKNRLRKKSQITIFIILGVIILVVTSLFFIMKRETGIEQIEQAGEEVPLEVKPIQEFVQSCLYKTSKEAFIMLGQHGGYIDMFNEDITGKNFKLDLTDPTESDGAFLTSDKRSHVAYWWFMKSKNSCFRCIVSDENKPSIESVERQVNKYIERNLENCISGFNEFKRMGFDVEPSGTINPVTRIAEDDIVIALSYPLTVKISDRETNMTRFISRLNLDFKSVYSFADSIVDAEANNMFLELVVKHLIAINGAPKFDKLPPIFSVGASFVPVSWSKPMVKFQLSSLFSSYFPLIQMNGTSGAKKINFSSDPLIQNMYNPFFVDVLNFSTGKYGVRFIYLNWPFYFDIRPSEGDTIKPSEIFEVKKGMGPFRIPFIFRPEYYYEYFYQLSIPVIAEIKSYNEFFNETYTMFVGLEVNIKDNKDLKEWFAGNGTIGPAEYNLFGLRANAELKEAIAMSEGEKPDDERSLEIIDGNFTKTLFCNTRQRISGDVSVRIFDKRNGSDIEGAEVYYSCADYESCKMGRTEFVVENNSVFLNSKFPICLGGGIIRVEMPGYFTERVVGISTEQNKDLSFEIGLEPIRIKNVSVRKFVVNRVVFNDSMANENKRFVWPMTPPIALENEDMVLITLKKLKEKPWEENFAKVIVFYGNDSKNKDVFRTVELVPGNFSIDIQYFFANSSEIPVNSTHYCGECRTDTCEKWCRLYPEKYSGMCEPDLTAAAAGSAAAALGAASFGLGSIIVGAGAVIGSATETACVKCEKCDVDIFQPENPIKMEIQILGGFVVNDSVPWVLKSEKLDSGNKIEFRLTHNQPPRKMEDLTDMQNITEFYYSFRSSLLPRFI